MLIEAHELHYSVNDTPILLGVDFALRAGEFVGLVGANGAGKSTLLKLMSGLWRGTRGTITLDGRPLASLRPREIARIVAHVPQSTHIDFAFSAREVVMMGRSPHLGRFQIEGARDEAIINRAMHMTDSAYLAERLVTTLSGGERQRVMIARALAQEPRVLLLDEPTSSLDILHQLAVMEMAQKLAHENGLGVVVAVHDLGLAARFCDRVVTLSCGSVVADGAPLDVLTPDILERAFGIRAQLYADPHHGQTALSVEGIASRIVHSPSG